MEYYYPTEEERKKYNLKCSLRFFDNYDNYNIFNNNDFLKFILETYGPSVFESENPFMFPEDYKNLTNEEICKTEDFSLKPQQKFMGQFINPNTNINSTLLFHGLGSGKTCTSLVIGEAFKSVAKQRLLYVVPASLISQYIEEIMGQLKGSKLYSCVSQCVVNDSRVEYTNANEKIILANLGKKIQEKKQELVDLSNIIELETKLQDMKDMKELKKKYIDDENELKRYEAIYRDFEANIINNVKKVFEIISHDVFINQLFQKAEDVYLKKIKLNPPLKSKSPLLEENNILVIDEIQRLISEKGILYKKLFTAVTQYFHPKLRIILMSATPIYDNPYELALTMNLLRPRIMFPLKKNDFYKYFIGEYNEDDECIESKNRYLTMDSCVINNNILKYMCSGYVSYFKGGNPNAYPYKRIIRMEHKMPVFQKTQYINALKSDLKKQVKLFKNVKDEFIFSNMESNEEDKMTGVYITSQQFSNIALPSIKSDDINSMLTQKTKKEIKTGLVNFKKEMNYYLGQSTETILNHLRAKQYSEKFVNIISLSLKCNGPVFIFSNWLQFGVEPLSIILNACGFKKYPEEGENRYFIWSSETKKYGDDLINKAKSLFNSYENRDGSKLKIILGTRSIMEGVSFKNVKQVHVTDPWWNESRFEQIIARAIRFCSHSDLPVNEQWVDIYRHFSVLPFGINTNDPDVVEMFKEVGQSSNFANLSQFSVEQKMLLASLKKSQINNEFDTILKEVSYDCDLNNNGNLIRLEENIEELSTGDYQIYYKNPSTKMLFIRPSIPQQITFKDILDRKFSFPNEFDLKFIEADKDLTGKLIAITEKPLIIEEPLINKDLILKEDIECWRNNNNFNQIIDTRSNLYKYLINITNNYLVLDEYKKKFLGKSGDRVLNFDIKKQLKGKIDIIKCLNVISELDITSDIQKKQIKNLLKTDISKDIIRQKIHDIIFKYKLLPEDYIEDLLELAITNPEQINEILKEVKK